MSKQCEQCSSFAVNHGCHGRDDSDADLCDVCYWRKRAEPAVCAWTHDDDYGLYNTECGNSFEFIEGTPAENNAKFCQYCGGKLEVKMAPNDYPELYDPRFSP